MNHQRCARRARAAVIICAAALFPIAARADTASLAFTNTSAPGGGIFDSFEPPVVSNGGFVALQGAVGVGPASLHGVYRFGGASNLLIARDGQPAPATLGGTSGAFDFITDPDFARVNVNASGQVLFNARVAGTSAADQGIFVAGVSGVPASLARKGDTAPSAAGTLISFENTFGLNNAGHIAFLGTSSLAGGALYQFSPGAGIVERFKEGQTVGPYTIDVLVDPVINNSSSIAVYAITSAGAGVFATGPTPVLAHSGQIAAGALLGTPAYVTINDSGDVGFLDADNSRIYKRNVSGTPLVRLSPLGVPNVELDQPKIDGAGNAVYFSYNFITGSQALQRTNGTTTQTLATMGAVAPGGAQKYRVINSFFVNEGNLVAIDADLEGLGADGSATETDAIYLTDGTESLVIAKRGQALAGSTVSSIGLAADPNGNGDPGGRSPFNDSAQFAYTATLADGRQGVFLFTPEIHWHNTVSGSWDTASNWTLGIKPGPLYSVFIDPTTALTVTGPTQDTTVLNLTIGLPSGTTPIATLQNATPGITLTVSDTLRLTARGQILHQAGTLAVKNVENTGGTLAVSGGTFSLTGNFHQTSGATTLIGNLTFAPGSALNVEGGTVGLNPNPASAAASAGNLAVTQSGGTLTYSATQHLAAITMTGGTATVSGGGDKVLVTNSLTLSGLAKIDMSDNDLIVHATPATRDAVANQLFNYVASAIHGGPAIWQGPGLGTSWPASHPLTTLAVTPNIRSDGSPLLTTFAGQPVNENDLLVKYTYTGDLDADGRVTIDDYVTMDLARANSLTGYWHGDLNYSGGPPDGDDFFLIDQSFLGQGTPLAAAHAAVVPEPSVLVVALTLALSLRRRRVAVGP